MVLVAFDLVVWLVTTDFGCKVAEDVVPDEAVLAEVGLVVVVVVDVFEF